MKMKKLFSEIPYIKGRRILLKKITEADAEALSSLVRSDAVYKYLPTFLFERKYDDIHYAIRRLYDECLEESIILGIFMGGDFCGIAEFYGYRDELHKISVGYRLSEEFWGNGIASETLSLMIDYLYTQTDIEIITASSMVENLASANVLRKNGFELVVHEASEDWGFDHPAIVDKWIR